MRKASRWMLMTGMCCLRRDCGRSSASGRSGFSPKPGEVGLRPQGVGRGCMGLMPRQHTHKPDLLGCQRIATELDARPAALHEVPYVLVVRAVRMLQHIVSVIGAEAGQ